MTLVEYEDQFHELVRHAKSVLLIEYMLVHYFFQGFKIHLCMATQSLDVSGRSFIEAFYCS